MLRKILRPAIALAVVYALLMTAVLAGGYALAQGNVPSGAVRLLGPVYPAYHAGSTDPLLDITVPGMTNLPQWITQNPLREQTTTTHKIPAGAVDLSGLPSGGGDGLPSVASDNTLTGDGTHDDPLGVASPFSSSDATKLAGVEERATRDQTPAEIVTGLTGLTGNDRLPASAVRDLPMGGSSGIASVVSDETLTGAGTTPDPLRVAVPVTLDQKTDLAALATLATSTNQGKFVGFDSSGGIVALDGTTTSGTNLASHGTLQELEATSPDPGTIAVVYGDVVGNDGLYYRTNTAWVQIAEELPTTIPASRLPQASGSASGIINAEEYAKIASAVDGADLHNTPALTNSQLEGSDAILLDDASVTSGSELKEISITELDKRWASAGDNTGSIALSRLPANTQIVSRAVQSGGNRPWPDDNVQFCGPLRATAYNPSEIATIAPNCGRTATREGGYALDPAYFVIRFNASVYTNQPSLSDVPKLRVGYVDTGGGDPPVVPGDLTALGESSGWWYFATSANLPGAQPGMVVEIDEPTTLDIDLAPGTVSPEDLKFAAGDRVDGRAVTILSDGEFSSQIITDSRTLHDGVLTGIAVTNAARTVRTQTINLSNGLNTQTEPHGIVSGAWTLTLTGRSSNSITFHNGLDTITIPFTTTIDAIAREPRYNAVDHLGYVLATTDILQGSTQLGDVALRAPQASTGTGWVSLLEEYDPLAGHGVTANWNIGSRLEMFVIGSGVPRGVGGGQWFAYAALPDARDFADGDLILVTGADNAGAWRKTSTETIRRADTGLAGLTLDPRFDFIARRDGDRDRIYYAPAGMGTNYPPSNQWGSAPNVVQSISLTYGHSDNTNGVLIIRFNGNRTYTGQITITSGVYALALRRFDATTWRIDGLTATEVSTLQRSTWTFGEPGATGYETVHSLTRVLAGPGPEYLLDWRPGTYVGLSGNQFVTLNTQPDWTRPLVAGDDNRNLCVQVVLTSNSNIDNPAWSSPMCVKAGEWRAATVTSNTGQFAPNGIYGIGTVIDAGAGSGAYTAYPVVATKGTADKVSIRAPGSLTNLQRIRIYLN